MYTVTVKSEVFIDGGVCNKIIKVWYLYVINHVLIQCRTALLIFIFEL